MATGQPGLSTPDGRSLESQSAQRMGECSAEGGEEEGRWGWYGGAKEREGARGTDGRLSEGAREGRGQ